MHQPGFFVRHLLAESDFAQKRHQRQRQDQRGNQRSNHRVGHRREDFSFVTLHRENRQVGDHDDDHREDCRPTDFDNGLLDGATARPMIVQLVGLAQTPENVFNDDHRAIDNDAEVHRPQGQQIGRNIDQRQPDEGAEHGQRNDRRHNARCAEIRKKQIEHQRHQKGPFEQVGKHGFQRFADQPGAVIKRDDLDARRQNAIVQGINLGF